MTEQTGTYQMRAQGGGIVVLVLEPHSTPQVEPPENVIDQLPTNENAEWPFIVWDRPLHKIRHITIHHSAGSRETTNVEYWHRFHTRSKGWSRVGYHFGIAKLNGAFDPIGLYQMNHLATVSWHDARNYDTVGVTFGGDMRAAYDARPNEEQLDGFGRLMAWLVPQLPNLKSIVGHNWWSSTQCPGDLPVWGGDLITAAAGYGMDISPYLRWESISLSRRTLNLLPRRMGLEAE